MGILVCQLINNVSVLKIQFKYMMITGAIRANESWGEKNRRS